MNIDTVRMNTSIDDADMYNISYLLHVHWLVATFVFVE